MDVAGSQFGEPVVVAIATIKDDHGALGQIESTRDGDIARLAFGDHGIVRQQSVMVKQKIDFEGPLVVFYFGQSNTSAHRSIMVLPKLRSLLVRPAVSLLRRAFGSQMRHQSGKKVPVDPPGAMLIAVGQRRMAGGLRHAEMHDFAFAHFQAFADLPEALRLAQLAKLHRHELIPATKTERMAFPVVLGHHALELRRGTCWRILLKMLDTRVRAWSLDWWILFLAVRILPNAEHQ